MPWCVRRPVKSGDYRAARPKIRRGKALEVQNGAKRSLRAVLPLLPKMHRYPIHSGAYGESWIHAVIHTRAGLKCNGILPSQGGLRKNVNATSERVHPGLKMRSPPGYLGTCSIADVFHVIPRVNLGGEGGDHVSFNA